jgi:hypothetical protein
MIISASRRTDIPALFPRWFIHRVRAGFCTVPSPFNSSQVSTIDLSPQAVDVIVFWTRFPRPFFPYINELATLGYRFYFQYTILNNPRILDRRSPGLEQAVETFCELSNMLGAERVIWRYDPIVLSNLTDVHFHAENYARIAQSLRGFTHRSVISIMDFYPKTTKRFTELTDAGFQLVSNDLIPSELGKLIPSLVQSAHENGMEIFSCAEPFNLNNYGVLPGKCVDDEYINKVFHIAVNHEKDPGQRKVCGCVISRDIGMYNTCLFECAYCYATQDFEHSRSRYYQHNPDSTSLY